MRALKRWGAPAHLPLALLLSLVLVFFGGNAAFADDANPAPSASAPADNKPGTEKSEDTNNDTTNQDNKGSDSNKEKPDTASDKPETKDTDKPKTTDPPKDEPDPGDQSGKEQNPSTGPPADDKKPAAEVGKAVKKADKPKQSKNNDAGEDADVDPTLERQLPTCEDRIAGFNVSLAADGDPKRVALYNKESILVDGPKTVTPGGTVFLGYEMQVDEGVSLKVWVVDDAGEKVKSLSPTIFGNPLTSEQCGTPDPPSGSHTPATCDNKVHEAYVEVPATGQNDTFRLMVNEEVVETKAISRGGSYTFKYTVTPGVAYRFKVVNSQGNQIGEPTGYTLTCAPDPECTKVNNGAAGAAQHVDVAVSGDRTSATFSLKAGSKPFCTPITPGGDLLQRDGYVDNWGSTTGAAKFPQTLVRRDQSSGTTLATPLTVNVGPLVCQGQVDYYVSVGGVNVGNRVTIDNHHGNTPGLKNLFGQLVGGDCPKPTNTVTVTEADCLGKYKVTVEGANIRDDFFVTLHAGSTEKVIKSQNGPKTYTNDELGLPDVPKTGTLQFDAVWGKNASMHADLKRPDNCNVKPTASTEVFCDASWTISFTATGEVPVRLTYDGATAERTLTAGETLLSNDELGLPNAQPGDKPLKIWYGEGFSKSLPDRQLVVPTDCEPETVPVNGPLTHCQGGTLNGKKMVIYVYPTAHIPGTTVVVTNGVKSAVFKLVGAIAYDNPAGKPVGQYEYRGFADFVPTEVRAEAVETATLSGKIVAGLNCKVAPPFNPPNPPNPQPPVANPPQLPVTGSSGLMPLMQFAFGALLIGAFLRIVARRRRTVLS